MSPAYLPLVIAALRRAHARFVFCLSFFACIVVNAQPVKVCEFLSDDTTIRNGYLREVVSINKQLIASLGKNYQSDYKEIYTDRQKSVEKLFEGRRVLTEKEAHNYLQAVLQKIVVANPQLQPLKLHLIFSRDGWPNAYSVGEGTIVVNLGLFVRLHNEAELAFVLCHELSHYYLDHSNQAIASYVEKVNSKDFKSDVRKISRTEYGRNAAFDALFRDLSFDHHRHSRNRETESDLFGLKLLRNTGYAGEAAVSVLELLDIIDDSILLAKPDIQGIFNFEAYPFKQRWLQKETSIFSQMGGDEAVSKSEKDSLKTHPDCSKRIALLKDSLVEFPASQTLFLVSEEKFTSLKNAFLPEMTEFFFTEDMLSYNLYLSLQMLQAGVQRPLAIYSIARDLNLIFEKQKEHSLGKVVEKENRNYPDSYNVLLRMIDRWTLDDIAAVNAAFCRRHKDEMKSYEGFTQEMLKAISLK